MNFDGILQICKAVVLGKGANPHNPTKMKDTGLIVPGFRWGIPPGATPQQLRAAVGMPREWKYKDSLKIKGLL